MSYNGRGCAAQGINYLVPNNVFPLNLEEHRGVVNKWLATPKLVEQPVSRLYYLMENRVPVAFMLMKDGAGNRLPGVPASYVTVDPTVRGGAPLRLLPYYLDDAHRALGPSCAIYWVEELTGRMFVMSQCPEGGSMDACTFKHVPIVLSHDGKTGAVKFGQLSWGGFKLSHPRVWDKLFGRRPAGTDSSARFSPYRACFAAHAGVTQAELAVGGSHPVTGAAELVTVDHVFGVLPPLLLLLLGYSGLSAPNLRALSYSHHGRRTKRDQGQAAQVAMRTALFTG